MSFDNKKLMKACVAVLAVLAVVAIAVFATRFQSIRQNQATSRDGSKPPSGETERAINGRTAPQPGPTSQLIDTQRLGAVPSVIGPNRLFFMDEQHGWLADNQGLWMSSDGGRTWAVVYFDKDITNGLDQIFFHNLKSGWLLRPSGLYKTDNGGKSWVQVLTPLEFPKGSISTFYFRRDGKEGWLAGGLYKKISLEESRNGPYPNNLVVELDDGYAVLYQAILHTKDGGETWQRQSLPAEVGRIHDVNFIDETHGVAFGSLGIFFTTDGGARWNRALFKKDCVDAEFIKIPDSEPEFVAFAGNQFAWVSYNNGRIMKSDDAGQTWCDLLRPEEVWRAGEKGSAYLSKLHFVNPTQGWGLKANGTLYKTEDAGRTWTQLDFNGARVEDVQFFNDYGLAVTKAELFRITF